MSEENTGNRKPPSLRSRFLKWWRSHIRRAQPSASQRDYELGWVKYQLFHPSTRGGYTFDLGPITFLYRDKTEAEAQQARDAIKAAMANASITGTHGYRDYPRFITITELGQVNPQVDGGYAFDVGPIRFIYSNEVEAQQARDAIKAAMPTLQ